MLIIDHYLDLIAQPSCLAKSFSLSLALLLSEPDLISILIYYIYAECKVTENIREWGQNAWISIANSYF